MRSSTRSTACWAPDSAEGPPDLADRGHALAGTRCAYRKRGCDHGTMDSIAKRSSIRESGCQHAVEAIAGTGGVDDLHLEARHVFYAVDHMDPCSVPPPCLDDGDTGGGGAELLEFR